MVPRPRLVREVVGPVRVLREARVVALLRREREAVVGAAEDLAAAVGGDDRDQAAPALVQAGGVVEGPARAELELDVSSGGHERRRPRARDAAGPRGL